MIPLTPSDKVEENSMVLILKKRLQSINSEYALTWDAALILEYLKTLYPLKKSINKELHGEICFFFFVNVEEIGMDTRPLLGKAAW